MRRDLFAAVAALALVAAFVLLLRDVTGLAFGRSGPFDLLTVDDSGTPPEGGVTSATEEALTFRGEALITVRAYDGDMTPALRTAPVPDSLNRVVSTMAGGGRPPEIVVRDLAGLDFELLRVDPVSGDSAFLIRVTPDDAVAERARTGQPLTAADVAEQWRSALEGALRVVSDSLARTGVSHP